MDVSITISTGDRFHSDTRVLTIFSRLIQSCLLWIHCLEALETGISLCSTSFTVVDEREIVVSYIHILGGFWWTRELSKLSHDNWTGDASISSKTFIVHFQKETRILWKKQLSKKNSLQLPLSKSIFFYSAAKNGFSISSEPSTGEIRIIAVPLNTESPKLRFWLVIWSVSKSLMCSVVLSRTRLRRGSYPFKVPITEQERWWLEWLSHPFTASTACSFSPSLPPLNFTRISLSWYLPRSRMDSFFGFSWPAWLPPRPPPRPPRPLPRPLSPPPRLDPLPPYKDRKR